jgi:E3 ubiquitin-protein ligase BAH
MQVRLKAGRCHLPSTSWRVSYLFADFAHDCLGLTFSRIAASDSRTVRPKLTVYVQLDGGVAVDASLTPSTRQALQKLIAGSRRGSEAEAQGLNRVESADMSAPADDVPTAAHPRDASAPILTRTVSNTAAGVATVERIEVPLNFDGEFFELLQTDLAQLDKLQRQEDDDMNREIVALRQDISEATKPRRFHKSDLAIWRELFELYSDAQIFFSSHERDHGTRSSAKALSQLVWFQDQIEIHNLPERFRLPSSHLAYSRFLALNATLLKRLKFQEINQRAVAKIMKSKHWAVLQPTA